MGSNQTTFGLLHILADGPNQYSHELGWLKTLSKQHLAKNRTALDVKMPSQFLPFRCTSWCNCFLKKSPSKSNSKARKKFRVGTQGWPTKWNWSRKKIVFDPKDPEKIFSGGGGRNGSSAIIMKAEVER